MADRLGISRPFYTQLERGSRKLSAENLIRIAGILDVPIGELCAEADTVPIAATRTFRHVIPIANPKLRKILDPLLHNPVESGERWRDLVRQAARELDHLSRSESDPLPGRKLAG
jgi:transcriptional regulator with XRE-family HTH domain